MDRRTFLRAGLAASLAVRPLRLPADDQRTGRVGTVTGPVAPDRLGPTLPHEHVLVDFIGADRVSRDRYDRDDVVEVLLPHLKRLREVGCRTLVECTPAYLGRDPVLLRRLSQAAGIQLLTNTGYYGAREGKFLPQHAYEESADRLADRWLAEWREGIEGTDVRPGFIKIGVDTGPLTEVNRKLVRAAARTHRASGLTIACHTGDGRAALEQLDILGEEQVSPQAWIWVHAQNERDSGIHREAAERGGWVEFDGVRPDSIDRHVELVRTMKRHGLLQRVLISQDAGWYSVGESDGGDFRSYETLFTEFVPALKKAGLNDREIRRLTVRNPAEAFVIRTRTHDKRTGR